MIPYFAYRGELFRWLDRYAAERKEELDHQRLSPTLGLPKAYLLETAADGSEAQSRALSSLPWPAQPTEDPHLIYLLDGQEPWAVLERLSARHVALYTLLRHQDFEHRFRKVILQNPWWDFAWFAGIALDLLWKEYLVEMHPYQFTKLAFEHEARFEALRNGFLTESDSAEPEEVEDELNEIESGDRPEQGEDEDTFPRERRASSLSIAELVGHIATFLPKLQEIHAPFRALKMLRLPALHRGGYDLWSWGKLTFRAPSFREGRVYLLTLTRMYQRATELLEQTAWIQAEPLRLPGGGVRLTGTSITFRFSQPLTPQTLHRFMEAIFGRARNLFRLWGNPIRRSERFFYVHGVDLHLWEPIGLECTTEYFRLYLPRGTCGNTVHRLARNLQRYVDPALEVRIGDRPYEDLFRQALWQVAASPSENLDASPGGRIPAPRDARAAFPVRRASR